MYFFNYKSLSGLGEFMANTTDNFSKTTNTYFFVSQIYTLIINLGISHGEDVLLIFTSDIRNQPYSKEEEIMIKNLIGVYYSFATEKVPSFNGFTIEKSTAEKRSYLKIVSDKNIKMIELDNEFGQVNFWVEIEKILTQTARASDEL